MRGLLRVIAGAAAGGVLAGVLAPRMRDLFGPPTGGVGVLTVHGYPKGWDYAVVALLTLLPLIGAVIAALTVRRGEAVGDDALRAHGRAVVWGTAVVVFVLMLFIHDHPYALMDPFHEGEHLTPAFLFSEGARPFSEVFVLHGLATDGGLDALVLGEPPSILRTRRLQTVLDAATLALLVPIAAEVTRTGAGFGFAVLTTLCGVAAFWIPVFPWFRLAPVLVAALALLRHLRHGSAVALFFALLAGTGGLLWSLDTGMYALAGVVCSLVILALFRLLPGRLSSARAVFAAAGAVAVPVVVLLLTGADLARFVTDSFRIIPNAVNAVWSLPAPPPFTLAGMHYYAPPLFYGGALGVAFLLHRHGRGRMASQLVVLTVLSLFLFRTAAGRVSWSHTRYAVPLLGVLAVVLLLEPLLSAKRRVAGAVVAILLVFYFEVPQNLQAGGKFLAGWRQRQSTAGLVRYPVPALRSIYTTPDNATQIATLAGFVESLPPGPVLDFTNERVLYPILGRKPPTRCFDIPMLSSPALRQEAMGQLEATPPVAVILGGDPMVATFDGLSNAQRVPELAAWIDARYPVRTELGRFVVATPRQ